MSATRRRFLGGTLAAVAASSLRAAPRARVEATAVISMQPQYYHGWPTLARRKNGGLIVAYSGGRESHVCPFGRVEMIRSSGDGEKWSWPQITMDTPIDDRDAGICETSTGSLLMTTFTSLAYRETRKKASGWPPERIARWDAAERRGSEKELDSLLGVWMLRSTDGGLTWSKPYRVPVNSPHGPSSLSNGRLLYVGKHLWETGKGVGACESTDDGRTWHQISEIPARPGDDAAEYHELHQIEAADGRIVVHIRNHNPQNARETLQCESADGGKTWSVPHPIGVWGLPSHLLRLRNGTLVMSYGYRRAPFGNQARISRDHGRTWSDPVTLSADGASGDLGYPSTVELEDGRLLTVWYEQMKDSPRAVLRMARWKLDA